MGGCGSEVERVPYQSEGWRFDPRLLHSQQSLTAVCEIVTELDLFDLCTYTWIFFFFGTLSTTFNNVFLVCFTKNVQQHVTHVSIYAI